MKLLREKDEAFGGGGGGGEKMKSLGREDAAFERER